MRGTRAVLATIRDSTGLDREQADAVFRKTHLKVRPRKNGPAQAEWEAFLDDRIQRLALDLEVGPREFDRSARKLNAAKTELPDARTYAALQEIDMRAQKAVSAIRRQLNSAAAFRGTEPDTVAERFAAYRAQYNKDLRHLPDGERPEPPEAWVQGFTTKDMMAVSAPQDRATLYAMYRCQADPQAYSGTTGKKFASIDLETAGPTGKAGFEPANGSIIEVGIIEYDPDGNETARYSQLIAPSPEVAEVCGTGAVDIHGITLEDVADAPAWTDVAPMVAARLNGRVLMAQNARFEGDWLNHHMHTEGQDFDKWGPTVDTMCIAKQHVPSLPNHRLATICEAVGVEYTGGHRALHDADVAGRAFFRLRNTITTEYTSNMARATTPQPPSGSGRTRRGPRRSHTTRLTAGDFSPATVDDPWATPQPVMVGAA